MAKYLSNIDLGKNQLQNAALHPLAAAPGTPVEGQVYFDTTVGDKMMYFYNGSAWVAMGAQGDITEIQSSTTGQLTVTNGTGPVPSLAIVTGAVANGGTALATGDQIYDFVIGLGYVESVTADNTSTFVDVTIGGTAADPTVGAELNATGTPSATTFLRGDNVWATPSGSYTSWSLEADTGTAVNITDGLRVDFTGGTAISTTVASATPNTLTIDLDDTAVSPGSYTYASITVDQQGRLTAASSGAAPGTMSSFTLAADGGTNQTITNGNTLSVLGTAPISTTASATDTVTITHDNSGVTANTYAYPASVVVNATGHITSITAGSAPGTMSSFTLTGDTGTNQTITNGNTLDVAGGTNISTVVGATDTVTVNLNDSITLSGTLTANGTGQHSFGGQVTIPSTPTAGTDAASKNYVDTVLAGSGALIYQGGYNAATNTPDLDSSPSASIKKGWTYTVTADGTFFTEQVRVGDVLIAESDAPTTLADWTTVQNNIDLATTTTVGIASFSSDNFAVSAAGAVTIKDNGVILGTETTGNYVATVGEGAGIDVTGSGTEGAAVTVTLDLNELTVGTTPTHLSGNDGSGNTRKFTIAEVADEVSAANGFAATISASGTVTHNLGTNDVIIQLYDTVTLETVYADMDRSSVNAVDITFASTPTNSIRVLVQKIG
jgi:hypothetical protein